MKNYFWQKRDDNWWYLTGRMPLVLSRDSESNPWMYGFLNFSGCTGCFNFKAAQTVIYQKVKECGLWDLSSDWPVT